MVRTRLMKTTQRSELTPREYTIKKSKKQWLLKKAKALRWPYTLPGAADLDSVTSDSDDDPKEDAKKYTSNTWCAYTGTPFSSGCYGMPTKLICAYCLFTKLFLVDPFRGS